MCELSLLIDKTMIGQAAWREVMVIWSSFERQKVEVRHFERANLSGFAMWSSMPKNT